MDKETLNKIDFVMNEARRYEYEALDFSKICNSWRNIICICQQLLAQEKGLA